jgi:carboxylesterase type B
VFTNITNSKGELDIDLDKARTFIIRLFAETFGHPSIGEKVADFVLKGLSDDNKTALAIAVSDSFGDFMISCPTILFGSLVSKWNKDKNSFAYVLTQQLSASLIGIKRPAWFGVYHGEDIFYVFGYPMRNKKFNFTQEDKELSQKIIKIWTDFAKTGRVSSPAKEVTWKSAIERDAKNPHVRYMDLNLNFSMVENAYEKTCERFWKNIITPDREEESEESKNPIVETKLGKVKGNEILLENGKEVREFIGIRYGKAPVGQLRFKKPIPSGPWNGTYDATQEKFSCMQNDSTLPDQFKGKNKSEDCLFLNIWQPKTQGKEKLPVMFWIHGGGFGENK